MTEIQLEKIKRIAHALDSDLDYCDVSHIGRWEDKVARDVMVVISPAGTPAHETKPIGKFQITSQGVISSYGEWK
jgi:hypothetical protein